MTALDELLAAPGAWPAELARRTGREGGPHLSASQINMLRRCPEQFRRVYVQGERRRPAGALVWGTADHKAHERNFRQKIDTGADIPVADVQLAFAEEWDRAVERDGGEREIDWEGEKPGELKDIGVGVVAAYHKQVSPRVQPVAVEERFSLEVPGVPVPVVGYVDVRAIVAGDDGAARILRAEQDILGELPANTPRRILERKTAKRKTAAPNDEQLVQALIYQAAFKTPVDFHLSVKTKTPAIFTPADEPGLGVPFHDQHVRQALAEVRLAARTLLSLYGEFGPDEPWPDGKGHRWACSLCGFRPSCPFWQHERLAA